MLFALALIPVIGLLLFIYFNDKGEREPFGFLIGLFFTGMATTITAIVAELIFHGLLNLYMPDESVIKSLILAILIVGPIEEMGKFFILRLRTWNSKHFDHTYDAIVYAVFISLGFAALENVGYVFDRGIGTAILRMFTAVPGHACFAVFMGFFYGKAKYAKVNNQKTSGLYILLTIIVPIFIHGVYDAILLCGGATGDDILTGISLFIWIGFVLAMFAVSFVIIIRSSRHDHNLIIPGEEVTWQPAYSPAQQNINAAYNQQGFQPPYAQPSYAQPASSPAYAQPAYTPTGVQTQPAYNPMTQYKPAPMPVQPAYTQTSAKPVTPTMLAMFWTCSCGASNQSNFCTSCGKKRPPEGNWYCPNCGELSSSKFCGKCGTAKPEK